jgi:hypothetical protein
MRKLNLKSKVIRGVGLKASIQITTPAWPRNLKLLQPLILEPANPTAKLVHHSVHKLLAHSIPRILLNLRTKNLSTGPKLLVEVHSVEVIE